MALIRVSDETRDLLREFAGSHAVSVSTLVECASQSLDPEASWHQLPPKVREWVTCARALDAERRSREPPS